MILGLVLLVLALTAHGRLPGLVVEVLLLFGAGLGTAEQTERAAQEGCQGRPAGVSRGEVTGEGIEATIVHGSVVPFLLVVPPHGVIPDRLPPSGRAAALPAVRRG